MAEKNLLTIGYWPGPGRANVHRYLLEYLHLPYNEVRYYDGNKWFQHDKQNLGIPVPNLPYLIDGEVKISETVLIANYIVEKSGKLELLGKGNDKWLVQNISILINDLGTQIWQASQAQGDEKVKKGNEIKQKILQANKVLGGKEWIFGYLTIADFFAYQYLGWFSREFPEIWKEIGKEWDALFARFNEIPQIKEYQQSNRFPGKKVILGYWPMAGRAQVHRFLLEHTGIPYEEVRYSERPQWFEKDKHGLGLPLPNLPYLIDGPVKISETVLIANYIVDKSGNQELAGKGDDKWLVQNIALLLNDLGFNIYLAIQAQGEDRTKKVNDIKPKIQQLTNILGNKQWLFGYLTVADFFAYLTLSRFAQVFPEVWQEVKGNWEQQFASFTELPKIKAYINSEKFIK